MHGPASTTSDPFTFELIKNALAATVDEMALTVVRTARSLIIKDAMDFSTAFLRADGELLAQGLSTPIHLGSFPDAIEAVLERFGDDLAPGDVILLNDPYAGGMHLPDIFLFVPMFWQGTLVGFPAAVAHQCDVGGRAAGGNAVDSTEVYAEGLRLGPLKLYEAGVANATLFEMIRRNVRLPDQLLGDIHAQIAACRTGEHHVERLIERYGLEALQQYFAELLDYSERLARAEIAALPDGEYRFVDHLDDDGFDHEPLRIEVAVTIDGDAVRVDFEGSAGMARSAINSTLSFTKSAVYLTLRSLMQADIPNNSGYFRPITVTAPPGTVVHAVPPAAVAARGLTGSRVVDALFGALAKAAPSRVFAAGEGGNSFMTIAGTQDGEPFIFSEFACGAWGGRPDRDGVEGVSTYYANLANVPIEVAESHFPVLIERYGFVPDSAGAGRYRGGVALRKDVRVLVDDATVQMRADRQRFLPFGLAGGAHGTHAGQRLNPDTDPRPLAGKGTTELQRGDMVSMFHAGAGGHGDPFTRDVEAVLDDVLNGKVTRTGAARDYGVVLRAGPEFAVDHEATARARKLQS